MKSLPCSGFLFSFWHVGFAWALYGRTELTWQKLELGHTESRCWWSSEPELAGWANPFYMWQTQILAGIVTEYLLFSSQGPSEISTLCYLRYLPSTVCRSEGVPCSQHKSFFKYENVATDVPKSKECIVILTQIPVSCISGISSVI